MTAVYTQNTKDKYLRFKNDTLTLQDKEQSKLFELKTLDFSREELLKVSM